MPSCVQAFSAAILDSQHAIAASQNKAEQDEGSDVFIQYMAQYRCKGKVHKWTGNYIRYVKNLPAPARTAQNMPWSSPSPYEQEQVLVNTSIRNPVRTGTFLFVNV